MKICILGIPNIPHGKHNLKDPRLDQAHRLVQASKKTCAQVDVAPAADILTADAVLVSRDSVHDLILKDLEFIETRLDRSPSDVERAALESIWTHLEGEGFVSTAELSPEQRQAVAAHQFHTTRPVVVAANGDMDEPNALLQKVFAASGHICFLTVGGKENRAWPVRCGATVWEAAGVVHSDIQKGFIRAEVIPFNDMIDAGGETQAKRAGKLRLEQKHYVVEDYDVLHFRFSK